MNLETLAKRYEHMETINRDPPLTDGKYLLAVEDIQKSEGHKGEFVHVRFRVQQSDNIEHIDETLLFKDEKAFPKALAANTIGKVSFKVSDQKQVNKLFALLTAIDPTFVDGARREKIISKMDAAEQPYRGILLDAKITRAKSEEGNKAYRLRKFQSAMATPDEVKAMRAQLDSTPAK